MKVALAHDYLNQYGGAERVLEVLMKIFPEAPIYTLLYDKEKTFGRFDGRVKKTSILDRDFIRKSHRPFLPLMPIAARFLNIDPGFDVVITSSAGFAKGFTHKHNSPAPYHVAYVHTPLRYAWEQEEYLSKILDKHQFAVARPVLNALKYLDFKSGQRPDVLVANSGYIAEKIKKYYKREAEVIHPPVDLSVFYPDPKGAKRKYYLAVGRLLHYKRFDLIVRAFNKLKLPLKIIGDGQELGTLQRMSYSNDIEFLGFVRDENELRKIYSQAKALIFPQVEDFGLVAVESIACGTPVIAYNAGGAKEIVQHGVNGMLFNEQTEDAIIHSVAEFSKKKFNAKKVSETAKQFSAENFREKIENLFV